jgi:hypothetical protein
MDKAMLFAPTPAPPCVAEEDSRDDKSDGGSEDRSMIGDVDYRGEDERGDSGVVGRASSTDWDVLRLSGNTTLPS